MVDPRWQDPECRARGRAGHRCVDKHGAFYASPERGPRAGSRCWFEQMSRLEDDRLAEVAELAALREFLDAYGIAS